jgi:predicted PurR-regulated permease PerM
MCVGCGAVGNALEPILFGKSLNMTPLSILAALVIWSALWGLMGVRTNYTRNH